MDPQTFPRGEGGPVTLQEWSPGHSRPDRRGHTAGSLLALLDQLDESQMGERSRRNPRPQCEHGGLCGRQETEGSG